MLPFFLMRRFLVGVFLAAFFGGAAAVADFSAPPDLQNLSASDSRGAENFAPRWLLVPNVDNPYTQIRTAQLNSCPCTGSLDIRRDAIPITPTSGTFIRGDFSGVRYENGGTANSGAFTHFWDAASDASGTGSQEIAFSASLRKTSVPAGKPFIRLRAFSNNIQVTSPWVDTRAIQIQFDFSQNRIETTSASRAYGVSAAVWGAATEGRGNANLLTNVATSGGVSYVNFSSLRPVFRINYPWLYFRGGSEDSVNALYAAGITGGTVGVSGGGATSGSKFTADISNLKNVLGGTPGADELRYQWQQRASSTADFADISGATGQVYTLGQNGFSGGAGSEVRVSVNDAAVASLKAAGQDWVGWVTEPAAVAATGGGGSGRVVTPPLDCQSPCLRMISDTGDIRDGGGVLLSLDAAGVNTSTTFSWRMYDESRTQVRTSADPTFTLSAAEVARFADPDNNAGGPRVELTFNWTDSGGTRQTQGYYFGSNTSGKIYPFGELRAVGAGVETGAVYSLDYSNAARRDGQPVTRSDFDNVLWYGGANREAAFNIPATGWTQLPGRPTRDTFRLTADAYATPYVRVIGFNLSGSTQWGTRSNVFVTLVAPPVVSPPGSCREPCIKLVGSTVGFSANTAVTASVDVSGAAGSGFNVSWYWRTASGGTPSGAFTSAGTGNALTIVSGAAGNVARGDRVYIASVTYQAGGVSVAKGLTLQQNNYFGELGATGSGLRAGATYNMDFSNLRAVNDGSTPDASDFSFFQWSGAASLNGAFGQLGSGTTYAIVSAIYSSPDSTGYRPLVRPEAVSRTGGDPLTGTPGVSRAVIGPVVVSAAALAVLPPNDCAVPCIRVISDSGTFGGEVTMSADISALSGASNFSYSWTYQNTETGTGQTEEVQASNLAGFPVVLTITYTDSGAAARTLVLEVSPHEDRLVGATGLTFAGGAYWLQLDNLRYAATGNRAADADEGITYQWQQAASAYGPWSNISGRAQGRAYDPLFGGGFDYSKPFIRGLVNSNVFEYPSPVVSLTNPNPPPPDCFCIRMVNDSAFTSGATVSLDFGGLSAYNPTINEYNWYLRVNRNEVITYTLINSARNLTVGASLANLVNHFNGGLVLSVSYSLSPTGGQSQVGLETSFTLFSGFYIGAPQTSGTGRHFPATYSVSAAGLRDLRGRQPDNSAFTWKWQNAVNAGGPWADIPGATGRTRALANDISRPFLRAVAIRLNVAEYPSGIALEQQQLPPPPGIVGSPLPILTGDGTVEGGGVTLTIDWSSFYDPNNTPPTITYQWSGAASGTNSYFVTPNPFNRGVFNVAITYRQGGGQTVWNFAPGNFGGFGWGQPFGMSGGSGNRFQPPGTEVGEYLWWDNTNVLAGGVPDSRNQFVLYYQRATREAGPYATFREVTDSPSGGSYQLTDADVGHYLRMVVRHKGNNVYFISTNTVHLSALDPGPGVALTLLNPVPNPAGTGSPYNSGRVGAVYSLNISDFPDGLTYAYRWYAVDVPGGGTPGVSSPQTLLAGEDGQTFTIGADSFASAPILPDGSRTRYLGVSVSVTDGSDSGEFGFYAVFPPWDTEGTVAVSPPAVFAPGSTLTASVGALTDNSNGNISGYEFPLTYQWQVLENGSYTDLAGESATTSVYTVPDIWGAGRGTLRLVVGAIDAIRQETLLNSEDYVIADVEPSGAPLVVVAHGGTPADTTLSVDLSGVTDGNNGTGAPSATYAWTTPSGGSGTDATYGLSADDVARIDADDNIFSVVVNYTDAVGFAAPEPYTVAVTVQTVGVNVSRAGRVFSAALADDSGLVNNPQYGWQQAAAGGAYEAIAGANAAAYTVPADFDASKPFVRVSVGYTDNDGADGVLYSTPQRAAGIESGAVVVSLGGFAADSPAVAEIGGLRNVLGAVATPAELNFQWQTGEAADAADASWADISGATLQTYNLQTGDFGGGKKYLRVVAANVGGGYAPAAPPTLTAAAVNADDPTGGGVSVQWGQGADAGDTHTVQTNGVTDGNGTNGTYAYKWFAADGDASSTVELAGRTGAVLTLVAADFSNAGRDSEIIASVVYTDPFGFVSQEFGATAYPLRAPPPPGLVGAPIVIALNNTPPDTPSGVTLSVDWSGFYNPNTATPTITYEWSGGASGTNSYFITPNGSSNDRYNVAVTYRQDGRLTVWNFTPGGFGSIGYGGTLLLRGGGGFGPPGNKVGNILYWNNAELRDTASGVGGTRNEYSIEWQTADEEAGPYAPAVPAREQYTISDADKGKYIRLVVQNNNNQLSHISDFVFVQAFEPGPGVALSLLNPVANPEGIGSPLNAGRVGAVYSLSVADFPSDLGALTYTYKWYGVSVSGGGTPSSSSPHTLLAGEDGQTFTLGADTFDGVPLLDVADGVRYIAVSVSVSDAGGSNTGEFGFYSVFPTWNTEGTVEISPPAAFAPGAGLTASVSALTDNSNGDPEVYEMPLFYQWQVYENGAYADIAGEAATMRVYTVPAGWNAAARGSLRLVVTAQDAIRYGTKLTAESDYVVADVEPTGAPVVVVTPGGRPTTDTTLSVDLSGVADGNNGTGAPSATYAWTSPSGGSGTGATYQLSADDITQIEADSNTFSVVVNYTDALGFAAPEPYTVVVNVQTADVMISRAGAVFSAALTDADGIVTNPQYSWQQAAAAGGPYEAIPGAPNADSYTVPADFDASKPFVRLSLGYTESGSGVVGALFSNAERAAGIESGSVVVSLGGFAADAPAVAEVGGLVNIRGAAATPAEAAYQWQAGSSAEAGDASWADISGATSQTYNLQLNDFILDQKYLRVVVADVAGYSSASSPVLTAAAVNVDDPTDGSGLAVAGRGAEAGDEFQADTDAVTDGNGTNGRYEYKWFAADGDASATVELTGRTGAVLTLEDSDFANPTRDSEIILSVIYADPFGFVSAEFGATTYPIRSTVADIPVSGLPVIRLAGSPTISAVFAADISGISDGNDSAENPGGAQSYEWFGLRADGTRSDSPIATGENYTLALSSWNTVYVSLGLVVVYRDGEFYRSTLTAAAVLIAQPTGGNAAISTDAANPTLDAVYSAAGATDANGGAFSSYTWYGINDSATVSISSAEMFTLNSSAGWSTAYVSLGLRAVYTDELGYLTTLDAAPVQISLPLTDAAVFAGAPPPTANAVFAAPNAQDRNGGGYDSYTWYGINDSATVSIAQAAEYTLSSAWNTAYVSLGLRAVYADSLGYRETLTGAVLVAMPTDGGGLNVAGRGTDAGTEYTAETDGVTDGNGTGGSYQYKWFTAPGGGGATVEITDGRTGAVLTLNDSDFADDAEGDVEVILSVIYTDPLGFVSEEFGATAFPLRSERVDQPTRGLPSIARPTAPTLNAVYTANVSGITDMNDSQSGNPGRVQSYQWYGVEADGTRSASLGNGATFTLSSSWNTVYVSLGLVVVYRDGDYYRATLTAAAAAQIAEPTRGRAAISEAATPTLNAVYSASTVGLTDDNGGAFDSYIWYGINDSATASISSAEMFTLNSSAGWSTAYVSLGLGVVWEDELGFRATLAAAPVLISLPLSGDVSISTNATPTLNAVYSASSGGLQDRNGGAFSSYVWYGINDSATVSISSAEMFTLNSSAGWSTAYVSLGLRAVWADGLGYRSMLDASPVLISLPLSGDASISTDAVNPTAGAVYHADSGGLQDANDGEGGGAGGFDSYVWYGINGNATVSIGTSPTFTLSSAWNTAYISLGLGAVYRDGLGYLAARDASPVVISLPLSGRAAISTDATAPTVNAVYRADAGGLQDRNGGAFDSYVWYGINDSATVSIGTSETFTLSSAWNTAYISLGLGVVYADSLGFRATLAASPVLIARGLRGGVEIYNQTPTVGAAYSVNVRNIGDDNGDGTLDSYEWLAVGGSCGRVTVGAAATYNLQQTSWNTNCDSLQVGVIYRDPLGFLATLTAAAVLINQPTQGTPVIDGDDSDGLVASLQLTANINSVSDQNGRMSVTYIWSRGDDELERGNNANVYTVTPMDVSLGFRIDLMVIYVDELGYTATLTAAGFGGKNILENEQASEEVAALFNIMEAQTASEAIAGHLNAVLSGGIGGRTAVEINGVRFAGREDLLAALGTRAANSANGEKLLAVDNFSLRRYASGGGDRQHSAVWLSGGWAGVSGSPLVAGDDGEDILFRYEGEQFGVFGGYDRAVRQLNARIGLAAGISDTRLSVNLDANDPNATLDDEMRRDLKMFLPYAEWRHNDGYLRAIGGIGRGELAVTETGVGANGCTAELDVDWNYAAVSGGYVLFGANNWDASMTGDFSRSGSGTEAGACGRTALPETSGESGKWAVGAYVQYDGDGLNPGIGFDARKRFGDITDNIAYDMVARLEAVTGTGLNFNIEGKTQLNDTTHRRESITGGARYTLGSFTATYRAETATEMPGILNRLDFGYAEVRGGNIWNGALYIERPAGGDTTTAGASLRVNF